MAIVRGLIQRGDQANWDGKTAAATRVDATGGTITGLAIGNEVDVLQVYGAGANRTRGSIAAAVQKIGSTTVTLVFAPGTWTIDDDLTIPANFTCHVPTGCIFDVASGKTLTLSGLVHVEYPASWTSGSGTVTLATTGPHFGISTSTAAERAASVTIVNFLYSPGNVLRYGKNTTPGTTVMTTAAQAAFDQAQENGGAPVYFPAGNYLIDATVSQVLTGSNDHERIQVYGDGAKSIITSTEIGAPTFRFEDSQFVTVHDLRFIGNNLTGASGNGHAIAFTDTLPQSGTFYPQSCDVRNVTIDQFRGNDIENTNTSTGVSTVAAGVYMADGIANYIDRCIISNCATGIHLDEISNSHVTRCAISVMDYWGIELDATDDGCSVARCDIINCGRDGNGDATVYSGALNYAGVLVLSNPNKVVIENCKFKTGQAITINASANVTIRENYIRCDAPAVVAASWAIQGLAFGEVSIIENEFEYLTGTGTNTSNAVHLDSNNSYPAVTNVMGNSFNHAEFGGYDIKYEGSSATDSNFIINHIGNAHGSSRDGRTDSTVDDCIILDTLNAHGQISGNAFTVTGNGAAAGGTITDCLDVSSIGSATSINQFKVFGNEARIYLTGGTITNDINAYEDYTPGTFANDDATPDISYKSIWHTGTNADTITDFGGFPPNGKIIVISEAAITYDTTGTSLVGSSVDLITAAGDVTEWVLDTDGFTWRLVAFVDVSVDNTAGA